MTTSKFVLALAVLVTPLLFAGCQAGVPISTTPQQGTSQTQSVVPATGTRISISGNAFVPADLGVKVGQTITWTNNDSYAHTVVSDDGSFDSGNLDSGKSYSFKFTKVGTYSYHCGIHTFMTGKVTVTQ